MNGTNDTNNTNATTGSSSKNDDGTSIIEEVLSPAAEPEATLPRPLAATADVLAVAATTREVGKEMSETNVPAEQRRKFAAQTRPSQGALTAVFARSMTRWEGVTRRANLPAGGVAGLLRFEIGVGAVWRAAWPLAHYGLLRCRESSDAMDARLQQIDGAARADKGLLSMALGKAEQVQTRQDQSGQNKQTRKTQRRQKAKDTVATQQQGVKKKRSAESLIGDITAGKARARLPAPPVPKTQGQGKKGKKR